MVGCFILITTPSARKPTSHPVPSDSHIGGFCIVPSPLLFGLIRDCFYSRHPCGRRQLLYPAWWVASGFCSLYSASLFMYPNQQLSQLVNSLHPSSYLSFHGGHLKFFSKTFTMFFLMSSVGSLNFIPFVNSSKTVIFLSFLPAAWRLPA